MDNNIREFSHLIEYNQKKLQDYINDQEDLIKKRENKGISSISYYFSKRNLSKVISTLQEAEEMLGELKNFRPSRLHISSEISNGINSILPLLDPKDIEKIKNLFYESVNSVRSEDESLLKRIKDGSGEFLSYSTDGHKVIFEKFYKTQKDIFQNHNYLTQFNFNNTAINEEQFISSSDNHLLDMIKELISAGKLENKYVKNNLEKIKNAMISKDKAIFVNSKIDDLLIINDTTSDIDFEKLKVILTDIRTKNQKIIQDAENVLGKFSEEEIQNEYSKFMQEKSQSKNAKESLEMYNKLMYEYMIAQKKGDSEKLETLKSRLSELKLDISPEEKMTIDLRIEERIKQEEQEKIKFEQFREKELSKISEEKRKLEEMRERAISRLARSGKLDETEHTVARENGEFETTVDGDSREQLISSEIKDIETEQNGQGGFKK